MIVNGTENASASIENTVHNDIEISILEELK